MPKDTSKTKKELIEELEALRFRLEELDRSGGPEFGRIAAIQKLEASVRARNLELERANKLLKIEVAERVQTENRLRESENQFQALFDSSVVGIYRSSPQGDLLAANRAFAVMLGYESSKQIVQNINDIASQLYVRPEERSAHMREAREAKGTVVSNVAELKRRDGSHIWAQIDKHIVRDQDGEILFFEGLAKDITDSRDVQQRLQESEERFRTVANFTYDWEYWRTPEGKLLWVSPSCERITGYRAEEFMADAGLLARIIHPDDQPLWEEHVELEALHRPTHSFDFRIRTKDGSTRWIGHNCFAVIGKDGNFLGRRASNHDITLRKQHEQELAEQFTFIQTLIDAAPTPIFYKDTDGVYLGCNQAFCNYRGLSRNQIIGQTVPDVVEPELADLHARIDREMLADGKPKTYFHEDTRTPRSVKHLVVSKAPFVSASGQTAGIIGVITDITEQRQAADQLRKLKRVVEQSPVSIVITDTRGVIEYVNPYFCRITGYDEKEALGARPNILQSGVHPPEHYKELWATIRNGNEWRGELVNRKKNGELYWEQSIISPIKDADGKITHFAAMKEDITQRKKAEEELTRSEARYRQVVEGTNNIITQVDSSGRFTFINHAAEAFYGLQAEQWMSMSAFSFIHPDDQAATEEAFKQWVAAKVERTNYENCQRSADGSYRILAWNIHLQFDDSGDLHAVNSIASDITEQKNLEKLKQDVERITRHDLKSPLMGILSVPQLLLNSDNLTDEQRALLEAMEESGFRMLSMINLSLDLYKMEVGTYQFLPQSLDLLPLVRKVVDDALKVRRRKKLSARLLVEGEPATSDTSFLVQGEELLCYSLFSNLVSNAVDAAPEASEITLDLRATGDRAQVTIHNQGVVPEGIRERFFDKYVTAGKSGGTGLGTYSAKLIAETQGGGVKLESSDQAGTTVTAILRSSA